MDGQDFEEKKLNKRIQHLLHTLQVSVDKHLCKLLQLKTTASD